MPVKLNEREYRQINVTGLETRAEDDNGMIVEGYATTFDQEYTLWDDGRYSVREKISRSAFDDTDMADVIMQYDHEGRVFARIKNSTLKLTVDDHGLKIRADLGGTELGRQLYEEIKGGYTDKMSFGFTVSKDERTEENDAANGKTIIHRTITGIKKLYDVSAVSIPANPNTDIISARSIGEGLIAEAEEERLAYEERQMKIKRIKIMMEAMT